MTVPALDTIEREKEKLYVTDAELIRRLGVPERLGRTVIRELDSKPTGFPRKQKLWGDRRYWPAVKEYLDRTNGMMVNGAARVAPESPHRSGLPRRSFTTEPVRRAQNERCA